MNTEMIKSILGETNIDKNEEILILLMEKAKSDEAIRRQITPAVLLAGFSEEELFAAGILVSGRHSVQSGSWFAFGRSLVTVSGDAEVCFFDRSVAGIKAGKASFYDYTSGGVQGEACIRAYDFSHVHMHESASGEFFGNASGEVHGSCSVVATDESFLRIWGRAGASAKGSAILIQTGKTKCVYSGSSSGHLNGASSAMAFENSHLVLHHTSNAEISDNADASVFDSSRIKMSGYSMAIARDFSKVDATGNSVVHIYESASALASGKAFVTLHDKAFTNACDQATLKLFDNSTARATGEVRATMAGNNIIEISSGDVHYNLQRNAPEGSGSRSVMELDMQGNSGHANIRK